MQPVGLQEWIHRIEEGEGTRLVRVVFFILALCGLAAAWHIREAKNFSAIEAMDGAQLARNLAEGKGFTTQVVRPFSLALLERHTGQMPNLQKQDHPDLANPPVYPLVMAAVLKMLPANWVIPEKFFWRFQPEVLIGGLNQLLFFGALLLVFRLGKSLFDPAVGWLAVVLMSLTELFWEFTTSGLSTLLLMVLFLGLANLLVRFEQGAREGAKGKGWLIGMGAVIGLLIGVMALTRYSMGWLIVPAAVYVGWCAGSARLPATLAALAVFALALAPWVARNYSVSGTPFGLAGYAIQQDTDIFTGHLLERSMPKNIGVELNKVNLQQYPRKLFVNGREILTNDLPKAAGSWIGALFLGSLLIPFRNPSLARLKGWLCGVLLLFLVVQALGRTELSAHAPQLNSENLLAVFTPLFFVFGAGFFFILLDQIEFPSPWFRSAAITGFVAVLSLPLVFRLLPPRSSPLNFPPYFPPLTQTVAEWVGPDELLMSDMPWAIAWYGNRKCVWTTLDMGSEAGDDFYRVNDEAGAIKGILLTPITTNARFLKEMRQSREGIWGKFYLDVVVLKNLPTGFPLKIAPPGLLPDWLFLSDRIRWRE